MAKKKRGAKIQDAFEDKIEGDEISEQNDETLEESEDVEQDAKDEPSEESVETPKDVSQEPVPKVVKEKKVEGLNKTPRKYHKFLN